MISCKRLDLFQRTWPISYGLDTIGESGDISISYSVEMERLSEVATENGIFYHGNGTKPSLVIAASSKSVCKDKIAEAIILTF